MFEPTVETGFNYLRQLQTYTGTSYGIDELQLIYELYLARKKYVGNASKQAMLDQVAADLSALQVSNGRTLLGQVSPAGDYNADGLVNMSDYNTWRTAYGKSTIIYGSGADGDFNGSIDLGDYLVWRKGLSAGGAGASFTAIPEPTSRCLLGFAAVLCCCVVNRGNRLS